MPSRRRPDTWPERRVRFQACAVAGPYADATRRAFVLHILDELIHHGAEGAQMRDLWAARTTD